MGSSLTMSFLTSIIFSYICDNYDNINEILKATRSNTRTFLKYEILSHLLFNTTNQSDVSLTMSINSCSCTTKPQSTVTTFMKFYK